MDTITAVPDVLVANEGSLFLVTPVSSRAKEWVEGNAYYTQTWGDAIVVEHRYVVPLIDGMHDAGLIVR